MREVRVTEKMCWKPPPSKPWNDGARTNTGSGAKIRVQETFVYR